MSGNRNNNNKSSAGGKKSAKDVRDPKEPGPSTDSLLSFLSSASSVMRKAMDVTKQGSAANSRKRDPNHRRHLINNMKESSLEYSAYNKRRYKRRSMSSGSAHNNGDSHADTSDYLTDTMKELFMNSTEENSASLDLQASSSGIDLLHEGAEYPGEGVYFQENEWAVETDSMVNTSDHYFNGSSELQLSPSYDNSYMAVGPSYMDPFEGGSNFTNSSSYLTSSLELSEMGAHFSESFNLAETHSLLCQDNLVASCGPSVGACSSCLYGCDKATGVPSENGNTNNNNLSRRRTERDNCPAPEALASGEFSSVDTRLVEHVLAQADIQATMNELVDIARPKRKRVSVTPTHDSDQLLSYPSHSYVYPECHLSQGNARAPLVEIRPKSWAASRQSHQHKLAHKRQSCPLPEPLRGPACSPSFRLHTTGLSPYQERFSYWECSGPPDGIGLVCN